MTQLSRNTSLDITFEQIDAASIHQAEKYLYQCLAVLIPQGAEVYSWPKHCWFPIESESDVMMHVFPPSPMKRSLPLLYNCGGISTEKLGERNFTAFINKAYREDVLTSFGETEAHAIAKVWVKAFLNGWVDMRYAQIASSWRYAEVRFTREPVTLSALSRKNQTVTPAKTVTAKTTPAVTVTPKQTVTVDTTSVETVTLIQSVTSDTKFCLCGCGAVCSGRQKLASVACRKRYSRARNAA